MKHSILCVDDEVDNVDSLERLFRRKYDVLKATSGRAALALLAQHPVTVIISDQRMPNMTGVELLSESIKTHPDAIRILLTGYTDIESVVAAINSGQIYRYVTKPWDPVDLSNAIDKAVERYEIGRELVEKNRALQDALDELQVLDQAKNQFMVLVNHELKTPLTSMLSFTDLLAETKLEAEQGKMLTRIKAAAVRLQEMINDALEFVSAETAQTRIDLKSVAARTLFSAAAVPELVMTVAKNRKVELEFVVENQNLMCDEKIVRNVFRRLLHNAVKFAEPSSTVTVRGHSHDGVFGVSLENKGAPIDQKRIDQLMKPFTLNENALNHSVGTGLGLPICQALLKLHASSLQFSSRESKVVVSFDLGLDPASLG
ncbi:MAG: hybrid sensor histidine kinase/response regulator [Bdellovibrionota bacterium]